MGKQWKQCQTLFWGTPKSLQMVIAEIKRRLLPGRKVMTNLDSIFGEGNGNPLQYSCLENLMDEGAWWATVHWVTKSQIQLSNTFTSLSDNSSI